MLARSLLLPYLLTLTRFSLPILAQNEIPIPEYKHGKVPNWLIPPLNREAGIQHLGRTSARLRVFLDRLMKGEHLNVSLVGASITVGHGAGGDGYSWARYLEFWFQDAFPGQVRVHNGAVAGTSSMYQSICTEMHAGFHSDLYIIEYAHNDQAVTGHPVMSDTRKGMERLLRKLLKLPQNPAVVFNHAYVWPEHHGKFWENAERDFHEYELYYSIPAVSVKGCCYQLMQKGVTGFRVDKIRLDDPKALMYQTFYGDGVHPEGLTGYRVMNELLVYLFLKEMDVLSTTLPLDERDRAAAAEPIPPPIVAGNEPALSERCFVGEGLQHVIVSTSGFEWLNESPIGLKRKKWGFIATQPGATLQVMLNTTPSVAPQTSTATPNSMQLVRVMVAYLQSYEHMGVAEIQCGGGCTCQPTRLVGHNTDRKVSQMEIHPFTVTPANECTLTMKVLAETSSGEHKVKIQGVFVSEDLGEGALGALSRGAIDTMQYVMPEGEKPIF